MTAIILHLPDDLAERRIQDGFADVIEHFTANVATEVHGPADRRGARVRGSES